MLSGGGEGVSVNRGSQMNLDALVCKPGGLALLCGNKSSRPFVLIAWKITEELLSLPIPTISLSVFHIHLVAY